MTAILQTTNYKRIFARFVLYFDKKEFVTKNSIEITSALVPQW